MRGSREREEGGEEKGVKLRGRAYRKENEGKKAETSRVYSILFC